MRLDLKYRPETFGDLIGQPLVVRYLATLIRQDEPRSIIMHGHFGSGKTSAARIYARALNCAAITVDCSPCNACENCTAARAGGLPDYLERSGAEWSKLCARRMALPGRDERMAHQSNKSMKRHVSETDSQSLLSPYLVRVGVA